MRKKTMVIHIILLLFYFGIVVLIWLFSFETKLYQKLHPLLRWALMLIISLPLTGLVCLGLFLALVYQNAYNIGINGFLFLLLIRLILQIFPKTRHWLRKKRLIYGLCYLAILLALLLWEINPNSYFKSVKIPYPDGLRTYRNQEILEHFKANQAVVALTLLGDYQGIESIEFQFIREVWRTDVAHVDQYFYGGILVNGKYPLICRFTQGTNLGLVADDDLLDVYDLDEAAYAEYDIKGYLLNHETELTKIEASEEIFYHQLDSKTYQDRLKAVDITYYEKNDIYKDYDPARDRVILPD